MAAHTHWQNVATAQEMTAWNVLQRCAMTGTEPSQQAIDRVLFLARQAADRRLQEFREQCEEVGRAERAVLQADLEDVTESDYFGAVDRSETLLLNVCADEQRGQFRQICDAARSEYEQRLLAQMQSQERTPTMA